MGNLSSPDVALTAHVFQNDVKNVSDYLLSKFVAVHKENAPYPGRELYTHMTTVTDTAATATIIANGKLITGLMLSFDLVVDITFSTGDDPQAAFAAKQSHVITLNLSRYYATPILLRITPYPLLKLDV